MSYQAYRAPRVPRVPPVRSSGAGGGRPVQHHTEHGHRTLPSQEIR